MSVTHDALAACRGLEVGISAEEVRNLHLYRLREQGMRPAAQNLGERIGEGPWLSQLNDVSVGHGVSLVWDDFCQHHFFSIFCSYGRFTSRR